jgi:DNA-binding MarR family transcriptional regulator
VLKRGGWLWAPRVTDRLRNGAFGASRGAGRGIVNLTPATGPAGRAGVIVDDGNRQGREAWAGVLKVHAALVPLLDRELRSAHALPLTWYDILLELDAAPDRRLTMGELGRRAVVSRTRTVRVVDELIRAGLVVRERHPDDRRSAYARLTEEGGRRCREAAPTYLAAVDRYFARHLTPAEAGTLAAALRRVLQARAGG